LVIFVNLPITCHDFKPQQKTPPVSTLLIPAASSFHHPSSHLKTSHNPPPIGRMKNVSSFILPLPALSMQHLATINLRSQAGNFMPG
jgi:hypothetical protein